jgi:hypothetical protein
MVLFTNDQLGGLGLALLFAIGLFQVSLSQLVRFLGQLAPIRWSMLRKVGDDFQI